MATTDAAAAQQQQAQQPQGNDPRGGPPRGSSKAEKEAFWRDMASKMNVGPNYELLKPVGAGAYGYVWSAYDTRVTTHGSRGDVAIKRIQGAFDRTTDAKRLLREILLLRHLKHPNTLQMLDLVVPPVEHPSQFNTVYIITEMMDTDLHKIVQSPQELTELHVQYFLYQMLKSLKYIHAAGIIHRDLKPSNLLLNENCELKLCDFGLARTFTGLDEEEEFTEYVVTRWYRAPEVLLQDKHYTTAVDVWAVGCTFAEMLKGSAIFPGNDYIDQLYCITDILGTPSKEVVSSIGAKQAQHFLSTMEQKPPKKFSTLFPKAKPEAVDLLEKMLRFDPKERISVDEALKHPYLKDLYEPDDKSAAGPTFAHDLSCASLTKYHLKELILEQAAEMHPEHKATLAALKEYHKELYLKQAEARQQLEQRGAAAAQAQAQPAAAPAQ